MTSLIAPLLVAVVATFVTTVEAGVQLNAAASRGMPGTYGMRPCKKCGSSRLHSRDELLDTDDGELNTMKDTLTKEVDVLEGEVEDLKEKNGAALGKLNKRLSDMNTAYTKFGKDTVARTNKFADAKAKASTEFDGSLESTAQAHEDIAALQASMAKMRTTIAPFVDKFISGKGWPKGCSKASICPGAKALLQRLQATLHVASLDVDTEDASQPARRAEALLRKSARTSNPADQEKYKLVRVVQQLEEKRAKLMKDKTMAITSFGEKQRITLDRIDVAKIKANLKATTERKYQDSNDSLEKTLKDQNKAAGSYEASAKAKLARLQKSEGASLELFKEFKAELTKCKCL
jgi:ElaB/YqjD/DUF883 family membrane-anchored ribosome-binding protein